MGGCGNGLGRRSYVITAPGILKIISLCLGAVPVVIAFILHDHYVNNGRPESQPHIMIPKGHREKWEMAFLVTLAGALGITLINLILWTLFTCLSTSTWTKRFDCGYFALIGMAQATLGFIMVGSALSSNPTEEPVELKYAAGFLGIATGVIYWGSATLVNTDS